MPAYSYMAAPPYCPVATLFIKVQLIMFPSPLLGAQYIAPP